MKVALLTRRLPPVLDGVGDYTWRLGRALRALGVEARLFASRGQAVPEGDDAWVHPVVGRWAGGGVLRALGEAGFRPDWCCLQWVPQLYGRFGLAWRAAGIPAALRAGAGTRVAVTVHEFAWQPGPHPRDAALAVAMRLQTRRLLGGADLAVTTCSRYARGLQALGGGPPVVTIPVGPAIEPTPAAPERLAALRQRHGLQGARVFGMFGRLAPYRNCPTAVRALARARSEALPARLLLIGEAASGALLDEVRALGRALGVEADLIVTGPLASAEVSEHLRLVDVFLFPQTDGLSTRNSTVMAALAHGLPLVAYAPAPGNFDYGPVPAAVLVPPGDAEGFVRAAVGALRSCNGGRPDPGACQAYLARHFAWPVIARAYRAALGMGGRGGER